MIEVNRRSETKKACPVRVSRKLWTGQYPLKQAFWGFYVAGSLLAVVVAGVASGVLISFLGRGGADLVGYGIIAAYIVIATIGTWRSAGKHHLTRWWPTLTKFLIVLWTVYLVVRVTTNNIVAH